ncbi:alcohol dehydrogenase [candidate division KSB1 bacterium]|nr:MAG: alcohol dehydrogenase [candidate division KSB1 bacterium]MBC6948650.1 alcohol dehydrogenase [candidate division KSB1 bacterium]MCE7944588.1 alcohol dehydrogenase [Chlorobi bacterium CHB1]MDL1875654.1 zinc-binding dehydrogenase [Cytophagia bacterium CHB2]
MKSVFINQHGDESVLTYGELPAPEAGPGQVLVEIKACALNHLDLWVRNGLPSLRLAMPHILGSDISGVVAQTGAGVSHIKAGEDIIISPGISCGQCKACLSGRDNYCFKYGVIGEHRTGGYAQYIVVPAVNIIPKPANLNFFEAAAYPLTFLTAWQMLVTKCRVQPQDWVLVLAAGSGVGVAAIQIAKLHNAIVIAAASSEAKLEKAKALGADFFINYETQNFREEVRKLTDKRGVDIIFEHVGEKTWEDSIKSLTPGGRIVTCGATTGYRAVTDLRYLFSRNLVLWGSIMGSKGEMLHVSELMKAGKLRPVIDRVMPLAEAPQAHRLLARREQFGKIVLAIE